MKQKIIFSIFCVGLLLTVVATFAASSKGGDLFDVFLENDDNLSSLDFIQQDDQYAARPVAINPDLAPAAALQSAYNSIAEAAIPAVVSIQVEGSSSSESQVQQFFGNDDFMKKFFGFEEAPRNSTRAFGSGFVISSDGYLISNHHVIKDADVIKIFFSENYTTYTAKVVGTDPDTDIALLKIEQKGPFPFLAMGNSETAKIGDIVVAIGNPFNLSHTFTTGVISAIGRSGIANSKYENYIQTDVAINPGNSGGPLINLSGEVIGINSVIISRGGGNLGIGFSIPINSAKRVVTELKETGTVTRGWIGIHYSEIDENIAQAMNIENTGIVISKVVANSPASKAGLKAGDIMTSFNKKKIYKSADLLNEIAKIKVGKRVAVEYYRDGKKRKSNITLGKQTQEKVSQNSSSQEKNFKTKAKQQAFGITVADMDRKFWQENGANSAFGVVIVSIERSSSLYQNGVREGDVIQSIGKTAVKSTAQFKKALESYNKDDSVLLKIFRKGFVSYIIAKL